MNLESSPIDSALCWKTLQYVQRNHEIQSNDEANDPAADLSVLADWLMLKEECLMG